MSGIVAGGFSLELARRVPDQTGVDEWDTVDLLAELVERSLVSTDAAIGTLDVPRYRLLETGRVYALERLAESGDVERIRSRHASAMRGLFDVAYEECWTMPEADFVARYEPELDNLRLGVEDFWLVAGSLILLLVANLLKGL